MGQTVPPEYFVELYRRERDPWNFEHSEYERRKYQATLDALPRHTYNNALELACSVGVFTGMLAQRCRRLRAVDVSDDALARARRLNARHPHVEFRRCTVPSEYPAGAYDLTTVCEVGFYFGVDISRRCVRMSYSIQCTAGRSFWSIGRRLLRGTRRQPQRCTRRSAAAVRSVG